MRWAVVVAIVVAMAIGVFCVRIPGPLSCAEALARYGKEMAVYMGVCTKR